jgi:hypothetical protein
VGRESAERSTCPLRASSLMDLARADRGFEVLPHGFRVFQMKAGTDQRAGGFPLQCSLKPSAVHSARCTRPCQPSGSNRKTRNAGPASSIPPPATEGPPTLGMTPSASRCWGLKGNLPPLFLVQHLQGKGIGREKCNIRLQPLPVVVKPSQPQCWRVIVRTWFPRPRDKRKTSDKSGRSKTA